MTLRIIAALALAAPAGAQQAPLPAATARPAMPPADAARMAAARRVVDLMHLETMYDRMFVQLTPVLAQGVIGSMSANADGRTFVEQVDARPDGRTRFVAILSQEFLAGMQRQYPALKDGMAAEFASHFTQQELEAVAAFYSSGAGAKMLQLQPELQQRMSQRGQELGRAAGAEAGLRAVKRATREILGRTEKPAS